MWSHDLEAALNLEEITEAHELEKTWSEELWLRKIINVVSLYTRD